MRGIFFATFAFAAFAAVAVNPAAAQWNGNPNGWFAPGGGLEAPLTVEGRLYGGWADATTFGWRVPSYDFGGSGAVRVPYGPFSVQASVAGEELNYSTSVGNPSFLTGGLHFDWTAAPGLQIGPFVGLDSGTLTFSNQQGLNAFVGVEGRQFFGPAVVGVQAGYFDNAAGAASLIRTGFVDARVKLSVGYFLDSPAWQNTIIGANVGVGSGTDSATLTGAQSTYWGASLLQGVPGTPFSVTFDYLHFDNHVDGTGTVWRQNEFLFGFRYLFPSAPGVRASPEPTEPLPTLLMRAALHF